MKQYYKNINNIKTRVTEWGDTDSPAVLCIHGMGATGIHFAEIGEKLADCNMTEESNTLKTQYRIIAPDLPGFGKSSAFTHEEKFTPENMAKWIQSLVRVLELKELFLLCHSWGANIGLFYITQNPEIVKKMISIDGGYFIKQEILKYSNDHSKLLFDAETIEQCIDEETQWVSENYGKTDFKSLKDYLDENKGYYRRWTTQIEAATSEELIKKGNDFYFHTSVETGIAVIKGIYNCPVDNAYAKIMKTGIGNKIKLLASSLCDDEDWKPIIQQMAEKFETETGAAIEYLALPHVMHWDDPDLIVKKAINWFHTI